MLIDEIDDGAQEYREGFAKARRGIDQAVFSMDDMVPGLFLERKWLVAFVGQPLLNDLVSYGFTKVQLHLVNLENNLAINCVQRRR